MKESKNVLEFAENLDYNVYDYNNAQEFAFVFSMGTKTGALGITKALLGGLP